MTTTKFPATVIDADKLYKEICDRIMELESDDRFPSKENPPASVFANAPLALIQVGMKKEVEVLKRILANFKK